MGFQLWQIRITTVNKILSKVSQFSIRLQLLFIKINMLSYHLYLFLRNKPDKIQVIL